MNITILKDLEGNILSLKICSKLVKFLTLYYETKNNFVRVKLFKYP